MAYFNHAFRKTFVGTEGFVNLDGERLGVGAGILGKGEFSFVDAKTWEFVNTGTLPTTCCNLILAAGSIYDRDKVGPFHGGYLETNKSKEINPKYVSRFYRVDSCTPQNNVIHVGSTPYTNGTGLLSVNNFVAGTETYTPGTYTDVEILGGSGTGALATVTVNGAGAITTIVVTYPGHSYLATDAGLTFSTAAVATPGSLTIAVAGTDSTFDVNTVTTAVDGCCKEFLCGETYYLRLDVKGSPALRFLNHNAYLTLEAYTGCCADDSVAPTAVDSTEVMIKWAQQIVDSPLIAPFVLPIVSDEAGNLWYAPGTVDSLGVPVLNTWNNYVSAGHTDGACAGIILNGAYVDTKFGDCTFQISDFYEKEVVRLYASEVDLNGDPCTFGGLCVVTECQGVQGNGFGETIIRDVILSEQYRQNFFSSDFRIREITQGTAAFSVINRNSLYTNYFIQHNVPRFNNPSSVFDNDQYLLQVVTEAPITAFETYVNGWLANCSDCKELEVFGCETDCTPVVPAVPVGIVP